ncbi:MAG: arginase [Crocinitomicaceae bacterium]|nr:arginase [Crocinitomicaceae bacterium]
MRNKIKFIVNPSEITAGTRGSSLGPYAIMTAARKAKSTLFGIREMEIISDQNHLLDHSDKHPFAKNIKGLVKVYETISESVYKTIQAGEFPLVLAADHGSAGGTIAGIKKAYPNKRLGVVWIDAHGDLHSPYTTPSGNMHGMPLSTVINEDNLPCKSNDVDAETSDLWNELKNMHGVAPKVLPSDLIFVGVRDTEHQEDALIERLNITNHKVETVRKDGVERILNAINAQLSACDILYISFDVDSMDPDITSYGTGTPVKNGLTPAEAQNLILGLMKSEKIVCFEIVEVNPCLDDKKNEMAEVTFGILNEVVEQFEKTK